MNLCFVVPRYGADIVGGAESLVRDFANRLVDAGHQVTVLTTCATDHLTWTNRLEMGREEVDGVVVHRYPITEPSDTHTKGRLYAPVMMGVTLARKFEMQLMKTMGYSELLFQAIDEWADRVDALCFCPYLYASTVFGVAVRPERSLILPCFHDEPFARVQLVQQSMQRAAGILFNTEAEQDLATQIVPALPPSRVVGPGIDLPGGADDDGWTPPTERDYIAYAGRREWGKNFHLLLEYTAAYGRLLSPDDPVTLLVMGRGDIAPPAPARDFVRDLGFVTHARMLKAISSSIAVVNLSTNESLSYLLLEAWSCGVPAIVHADCAVTRSLCEVSGGGLWVRTPEEFASAVDRLRFQPGLRSSLGEAGRRYVRENHSWPGAIRRLESAVAELVTAA